MRRHISFFSRGTYNRCFEDEHVLNETALTLLRVLYQAAKTSYGQRESLLQALRQISEVYQGNKISASVLKSQFTAGDLSQFNYQQQLASITDHNVQLSLEASAQKKAVYRNILGSALAAYDINGFEQLSRLNG